MVTQLPDKRTRLVHTAARLVHQQGFNQTTLADIAKDANVPLGNVYYYFKTKEALGGALIEYRAANSHVRSDALAHAAGPHERLNALIDLMLADRSAIARSGCPIGSLCSELHKAGGPLAEQSRQLFDQVLTWLEAQFRELGHGRDSRGLAVHALSAIQGATLLTHTFGDPSYLLTEGRRLKEWIAALAGDRPTTHRAARDGQRPIRRGSTRARSAQRREK
jgi:AcrR family transcriptional regulator